jgi:hypothetical protein
MKAKDLFLVYKSCPESCTKEYIRDKLLKLKLDKWVIARNHGSFYCLISMKRITEITNEQLDIDGIKCHFERVKDVEKAAALTELKGTWIGKGFLCTLL